MGRGFRRRAGQVLRRRSWRIALTIVLAGCGIRFAGAAEFDATRPVAGLRRNLPQHYALVGARLVLSPSHAVEVGNVVVKDGVIVAVGGEVDVPKEATQWDLSGKVIYPGLIDAYSQVAAEPRNDDQGVGYWNSHIRPELLIADVYESDPKRSEQYRSQGVTVRLIAPRDAIIKGQSAVVTTGDGVHGQTLVKSCTALHVRLTVPRGVSVDSNPSSPMGAVALARQAIYDALWYRDAWQVHRANSGSPRPEQNSSLEAMQPYVQEQRLVILETPDEQYLLRADRFAREFGLRVAFLGSGHEYRRLKEIQAAGRPIIVPLDFPQAPDVSTAETASAVSLERLMHWDHAPENAARLHQVGVPIALTAHGLDSPGELLKHVRTAVQRGLAPNDALRALTETPARLLDIDRVVGTLAPGKLAHLLVADGDLFDDETRVLETWVDGKRYIVESETAPDLRGTWRLNVAGRDQTPDLLLSGKPGRPKGHWQSASSVDSPPTSEDDSETNERRKRQTLKSVQQHGPSVSAQFDASQWELGQGVALISATVVTTDSDMLKMVGRVTLPGGDYVEFVGHRTAEFDEGAEDESDSGDAASGDRDDDDAPEDDDEEGTSSDGPRDPSEPASFPVNYPLGAFGVDEPPRQAEWILFRNGTIWTCSPAGRLVEGDLLVHRGRIEAVASTIEDVPDGTVVVDCEGRHLTPGIIDCHSHMGTDGGVNEISQAITAEVRVGDFVDARDVSIYRQLAGGVTTSNILHGSANPIGGQNQVIKLRWGETGERMKFREAPEGIKFALGENVTRSNWSDRASPRYPQSRMGVEQIIRDAILAARQYRQRQRDWQSHRQGLPPRHDLELEALAEIQEGKRWIHCHSYRQDEILALLRTLESFGIQIGTLQHILEGYKVADAMKRHGAMASAFSDWWAYKFEVYDAIPFNGAIMHNEGIVVSFNSDDHELARHLNHEAAKAVKYGGVSPDEALKFVTLNPARQLRIDEYVGSLESGKQADIVVWSGPPLSVLSRCEQTWIDGRKYFDIVQDRHARSRWREMRATLVQKILSSGEPMQDEDEREPDERELWPRVDVYCSCGRLDATN